MLWNGSQVPKEEDKEEAVTKKAIKELEIFVSQLIFYNFFLFISFFSITLLYHFFSILFFLPTTFTCTHDPHPRPTTFSYTRLIYNCYHLSNVWYQTSNMTDIKRLLPEVWCVMLYVMLYNCYQTSDIRQMTSDVW